jgi:hypothetical protein
VPLPNLALDFLTVWNAIADAVEGRSIRVLGPDGPATYTIGTRFFGTQPELREGPAGFLSWTLTCFDEIASDFQTNEPVHETLTVHAAAPYLDGVGVATLALADGQTLQVTRWVRGNDGAEAGEVLTVTLSAADFANIGAATVAELGVVLTRDLPQLTVTHQPGNVIRLRHQSADAFAALQVTGGTAAALVGSFPSHRVQGRNAGDEIRVLDAPVFYHFPFQLTTRTKEFGHSRNMRDVIDRLFVYSGSFNGRFVQVGDQWHEVLATPPSSTHVPSEGLFVTAHPFQLRNVPVARHLALSQLAGDDYRGGNYGGAGEPTFIQGPTNLELQFGVEIG